MIKDWVGEKKLSVMSSFLSECDIRTYTGFGGKNSALNLYLHVCVPEIYLFYFETTESRWASKE